MRDDDPQGGGEIEAPREIEWGIVRFRVQIHNTPITVTLRIDP